ncbi:MAG: glycine zipper 2TM domain-containing protein, partial [Pseudoxanthomonas sp.]
MKRLTASLLAASLVFAGNAAAQSSGYYPSQDDGYRNTKGYASQAGTYDYARVVRVDPVIGSGYRSSTRDGTRCYESQSNDVYVGNERSYGNDDRYGGNDGYYGNGAYNGRDAGVINGNEGTRTMATVIGGIAGAVLGSKIGEGSGRYVGTAVGSMVGGMAGRSIYDSSVRNRQYQRRGTVSVCDPV